MARYWYSYTSSNNAAPAIYTPSNYVYAEGLHECTSGRNKPCGIYVPGASPAPGSHPPSISPRIQTYIGQTTHWAYLPPPAVTYVFKRE